MDDKTAMPTREVRIIPTEDVELRVTRDDDGAPTELTGYAAVFNKDSVDMGWIEQVRPGAFTNALKESDVRALFNHDSNQILGRTKSNTLTLAEDDRGLRFVVTLPNTQNARDIAESIDRGDVDGCSFAFTTKSHEWDLATEDGQRDRRYITEVAELFDVGPVVYPAYPDTTVAARSLEKLREERAVVVKTDKAVPDDTQHEQNKRALAECDEIESQEALRTVKRAIARKM